MYCLHTYSTGAATHRSEAIGKSRGGNSTKIHLIVDSFGLPIYFELSEGQRNDVTHAESLVKHAGNFGCFIADKGYDSKALRELIFNLNKTSIIPKRNYGKDLSPNLVDKHLYKIRYLVENAFARVKHYVAIATRYDKLECCNCFYYDVVTHVCLKNGLKMSTAPNNIMRVFAIDHNEKRFLIEPYDVKQ